MAVGGRGEVGMAVGGSHRTASEPNTARELLPQRAGLATKNAAGKNKTIDPIQAVQTGLPDDSLAGFFG